MVKLFYNFTVEKKMSELVLYTNPMSRGRIVRWLLEELNVPYQTKIVEYGAAMKSSEFLAVNPMGKVPAIKHGLSCRCFCG
jgi:glutathione S-transferase